MPYEDHKRAAKFYKAAFGWQTQMLGEDMGNYLLATTTERTKRVPNGPVPSTAAFSRRNPTGPCNTRPW